MKNFIYTFLLILVFLSIAGCEECVCDTNPIGTIRIKLSPNDENPEVLVTVFKGRIESQDTLLSEYVKDSRLAYYFDANTYYSATAHYFKNRRKYVAIDGRQMNTSTDNCDCENGQDITLDLRLKD